MKAAFFEQFGAPDVIKYGDLPDPTPADGEVIVDVHAASVNAADWKFRAGEYARHAQTRFPQIPGRDFSGVVSAVGKGADLKTGDAVFGVLAAGKEGTYAEKIPVNAAIIARKPSALSHIDAAALALIGLTAVNAVEDTLKLQRGETILVQGGAGGVASFAIQLAKHLGARVVTTASEGNRAYVTALGADLVIDYQKEDFIKRAGPCDVVFDTVGGEVQVRSYEVLKPGGRLVWIAPAPEGFAPSRKDVQVLRPNVARDRAHLQRILDLWEKGAVKPPEITRFKLADAAEAHRISEARHLRGKLVFQVR